MQDFSVYKFVFYPLKKKCVCETHMVGYLFILLNFQYSRDDRDYTKVNLRELLRGYTEVVNIIELIKYVYSILFKSVVSIMPWSNTHERHCGDHIE